jgi:hypothetical protein
MQKLMAALFAAALTALSGQAMAQAQAHSNEISLFGSYDDVDEPTEAEVFNLNLRYGRFLSPQLVATLGLNRSSFETDAAESTSTAILVGAKYYFGEVRAQNLVPFADAAVGFANTDATGVGDSTDLTWEFGGGAAFMFSEATSLDAALRFYHTDTDSRTKGLRLFVGLTTRF